MVSYTCPPFVSENPGSLPAISVSTRKTGIQLANILHCETNPVMMDCYIKLEIASKPREMCFKPTVWCRIETREAVSQ